jgi:hypothetical protein
MGRVSVVGVILSVALASAALAVPKYYEIAGGNINGNVADPGLVLNYTLAPGVAGTNFNLNDGNSNAFDFFSIWTNETYVNSDDLVSKAITATLNFSDPLTGATVNGVTFGGSIIFGISQWGEVQWGGPATVTLGDRVFSLSLSNETFNPGFFGLSNGQSCGAIVRATITQISSTSGSPSQVPEHANTAMLFGVSFAAIMLFWRRFALS